MQFHSKCISHATTHSCNSHHYQRDCVEITRPWLYLWSQNFLHSETQTSKSTQMMQKYEIYYEAMLLWGSKLLLNVHAYPNLSTDGRHVAAFRRHLYNTKTRSCLVLKKETWVLELNSSEEIEDVLATMKMSFGGWKPAFHYYRIQLVIDRSSLESSAMEVWKN